MRILIIEDNPLMANSLARELKEEDYTVDITHDGEEGLYKAANWDYDCIILDLMLPKLNGHQLLQKLRGEKDTPVLIISSEHGVKARINSLNLGADDYMVKPFDLGELLARLRSLIRRSKGRPTNIISFQDVEVDTISRTVSKAGSVVKLTRKEFDILISLSNRNGRIVTNEFLNDNYIDNDDGVASNAIAVHMYSLRKKLGKDLIENVHGQGYKINP
ncbi:response regulator transcription factor [Rubellicoccus peritrichatus]|uniref:Response regulator transcription factor n=1 Tax=Rubellicoccus peritrichatus TaxID=3080537 RepID=A0AAQ3LE52_9BACT|nr:response regulator transcription factor [Puniceicoccus sp. CR14]WOO43722.1 response regulator transcription factor [Puniceicoccus sp. CR14]